MIVKKVGASYLFVFPSAGKIKGVKNPAGKITIGKTIAVLYALEIIRGRARFIDVDATSLPPEVLAKIRLAIKSAQSDKHFGFMVRDSRQPLLTIHIDPSFMAEVKDKSQLQQKMARQGNLSLSIATVRGEVRVVNVICD